MGKVIVFPQCIPYPNRAADLGPADGVLLIAIRSWVEGFRANTDPMAGICQQLHAAGAPDAAFSIDGLMSVIAHLVRRPVDIHCPRCPNLSRDEQQLLHAASLAQAGDKHLAEKALRTTLLSAEGAAFAVGPLEGLSALFIQARLFLTRHLPPATGRATQHDEEVFSPPRTLH
jgi:hypothetical protein